MKFTIFAAVVLLMTSAVMIQARSVTSQVGGIFFAIKQNCALFIQRSIDFNVIMRNFCVTCTHQMLWKGYVFITFLTD